MKTADWTPLAPAERPASLGRYVALISRARLRAAWRRVRRRRLGLVGLAVLGLMMAVLAAGAAIVGLGVGRALATPAQLGSFLARLEIPAADLPLLVPNAIFLAGWLTLFLLTFASLLGTLYLRKDLPALLVAPVPIRAVFLAQFLEALALPLLWTLALGGPALWGFGLGMGFNLLYFPLSLLLLLCLPLVPLGLSAGLTLLLLRLVPAPRAAEILTLAGTLIGVAIWIGSQSIGDLLSASGASGTDVARGGLALAHPLLPWSWASRGLVLMGSGDLLAGLIFLTLFAGLSLGTLTASVLVAERVYYDGWVQGGQARRRRRQGKRRSTSRDWIARLAPRPAAAIARKDWRLMRRDPRGYSSLIWILAMLVFWSWRAGQGGREPTGLEGVGGSLVPLLASLAPVAFALLVSGLRWGMESVSRDQRAFQIVQVAPVATRHIVAGKWLGAYLPGLALATVVLAVFSIVSGQLSALTMARNFLIAAPILAGETAILLALGAARPNFDWSDPKEMSGGVTGCLGALATWLFVAVALFIVAMGMVLPVLLNLPPILGIGAWLAMLALTGAVMLGSLAFAADRLATVEL